MMRAVVLLCDHAQVADNKLFISGAGISRVSQNAPTSLALIIYVPWDQSNTQIPYSLHLETSDGVRDLPSQSGESLRIELAGAVEVGRPAGVTPGVPLEVPLGMGVAPIPLQPGRYMWRLTIGGVTHDSWTAAFELLS